jgi:hypothetical protein
MMARFHCPPPFSNHRLATKHWKVKVIDPLGARRSGQCPLSPSEVGLVLQALGFGNDTIVYVASGELFGGPPALAELKRRFSNLASKVRAVPLVGR